MSDLESFESVIEFWFQTLSPADWWKKNPQLDATIKVRFQELHRQANACELFHWRSQPIGRLAEIIVLDQFSRNMFRDTPEAFASDSLALALAQEAVACGADRKIDPDKRAFLYMPYMHSESAVVHEEAMKLFSELNAKGNLDAMVKHKAIIDQFGRYPHRNTILDRASTPEELQFLKQPGSSF